MGGDLLDLAPGLRYWWWNVPEAGRGVAQPVTVIDITRYANQEAEPARAPTWLWAAGFGLAVAGYIIIKRRK